MSTTRSLSLAAAVLAAAFVAWLVTVQRMEGMNGGPGTDLGALGWYVGVWVTMMAAMMLPAVLPVVLLFARVSSERMRRGQAAVGTPVFLAGYFGVWTAFGLVAYGIARLVVGQHFAFLQWDNQGRYVAAGAIGLAAAFFVEKVLPRGERLTWALGALLVGLAIWIVVSPGSVPWLVQPGSMGGMQM